MHALERKHQSIDSRLRFLRLVGINQLWTSNDSVRISVHGPRADYSRTLSSHRRASVVAPATTFWFVGQHSRFMAFWINPARSRNCRRFRRRELGASRIVQVDYATITKSHRGGIS